MRVGDELVSSGLGGRIPAGFRVGRIALIKDTQADNFRSINVTPAANFIDNAYVLILQDKATVTIDVDQPKFATAPNTPIDSTISSIATQSNDNSTSQLSAQNLVAATHDSALR